MVRWLGYSGGWGQVALDTHEHCVKRIGSGGFGHTGALCQEDGSGGFGHSRALCQEDGSRGFVHL